MQPTNFKVLTPMGMLLGATLFGIGCGGSSSASSPTASDACAALEGKVIAASAIGLATTGATVQSAVLVAASDSTNTNSVEYCQVTGAIHPVDYNAPDIKFRVDLPTAWNNKSLQFGGGGMNGSIPNIEGGFVSQPASVANPLKQGYVTLGSDSGHESVGGFSSPFALNDEALANFGRQQIKKTHDVAMELVKARYGALPAQNYFAGGSQGGHEGFIAAEYYPEDYDGVVIGYPAYNVTLLHMADNNIGKILYGTHGGSVGSTCAAGDGWISPGKTALIYNAIVAKCDSLDGLADGIVSNPNDATCRAYTNTLLLETSANPLRCSTLVNGVAQDDGDTCLSDVQIDSLNALNSRYTLPTGIYAQGGLTSLGKLPILDGTPFVTESFGASKTYSNPGSFSDAFLYAATDPTVKYIITKNLTIDSIKDFNLADYADRFMEVSNLLDASSVNMDAFKAKGGKVLWFHGAHDSSITPYNSIDYYTRFVTKYTQAKLDNFMRFTLVPGFGHGSGKFLLNADWLGALDAWVVKGTDPGTMVGTDGNTASSTSATNGRTRPLCAYPKYPKYTGPSSATQAQLNDAANYTCTVP